jgi:hypothetical protein
MVIDFMTGDICLCLTRRYKEKIVVIKVAIIMNRLTHTIVDMDAIIPAELPNKNTIAI